MKYEKFEGSLGEFLEHHAKGSKDFCTLDAGHAYFISEVNIDDLVNLYNQGVYTEKEEVWTDHLPALCWVSDYENDESEWCIRKVYCVNYNGCYETDNYDVWKYARPVTQAEIDKMIWKRGD